MHKTRIRLYLNKQVTHSGEIQLLTQYKPKRAGSLQRHMLGVFERK